MQILNKITRLALLAGLLDVYLEKIYRTGL